MGNVIICIKHIVQPHIGLPKLHRFVSRKPSLFSLIKNSRRILLIFANEITYWHSENGSNHKILIKGLWHQA